MSQNYDYGLVPTGRAARGIPSSKTGRTTTGGMKCPDCGETRAIALETRSTDLYELRRRACGSCGTRFQTREYIEKISLRPVGPASPWMLSAIRVEWKRNVDKVIAGTMS